MNSHWTLLWQHSSCCHTPKHPCWRMTSAYRRHPWQSAASLGLSCARWKCWRSAGPEAAPSSLCTFLVGWIFIRRGLLEYYAKGNRQLDGREVWFTRFHLCCLWFKEVPLSHPICRRSRWRWCLFRFLSGRIRTHRRQPRSLERRCSGLASHYWG